jgi:4-amino-4-deoxy-L-arabinose transferase-like glycosyltransferase
MQRHLSRDDIRLCALHVVILVPLAVFLAFYNLHTGANWGTGTGIDESWYIQVSQEMSQSGRWWLPTREGEPFFYKPPLKYWLTSLSAAILGDHIVAYRIVDAVCGSLVVLIAYGVAATVFSSLNAGLFAALSLLATHGFLFLNGIRFATLDTMVMLLDVAALLIVAHITLLERQIPAREQMKWGLMVGVLVGLAVLTKSVLGYYIVGIYGVWILLTGQVRHAFCRLRRFFVVAAACSLVIPALWFVPHSLFTPGAFDRMFGYELVRRFGNKLHNGNNRSLYWDAFVGQRYLPFYTTIIASTALSLRIAINRERRLVLFLVWATLPFCVFTALSSRLTWYVAPCYFPAAILNGGFIAWCIEKVVAYVASVRSARFSGRQSVVALACALVVAFSLAETGWYVGRNAVRVWNGSPRLPIDELVSEVNAARNPPLSLSFNAPAAATRERIFFNMLIPHPVTINNQADLLAATAKAETYLIFTDLSTAAALTSKLSFAKYRYLPPVTFPQGPQAVSRAEPAFALLGGGADKGV